MVIDVSVILQSPPFIISGRLVFSISSLCIVSALRERLKSGNAWNVPMRTLPVPIALRTNAKNRSKYPALLQHARVECLHASVIVGPRCQHVSVLCLFACCTSAV